MRKYTAMQIDTRNNLIRVINQVRREGKNNLWDSRAGRLAKEMIDDDCPHLMIMRHLANYLNDQL